MIELEIDRLYPARSSFPLLDSRFTYSLGRFPSLVRGEIYISFRDARRFQEARPGQTLYMIAFAPYQGGNLPVLVKKKKHRPGIYRRR